MTNRNSGSGPIAANAQQFLSLTGATQHPALDPEQNRSMRRTGYLEIDTTAGVGDIQLQGLAPGSGGQELRIARNTGNNLLVRHWDAAAEYGWKLAVPNLTIGTANASFYRFIDAGTLELVYVVPPDDAPVTEPYWRIITPFSIAVGE